MFNPISEAYNTDCMDYMRTVPDKAFDLAIADPPYGLPKSCFEGSGKLRTRVLRVMNTAWDIAPPKEFFDELFRVSKHQIIWGGNYFDLPPTRGICVWDKCQPWENFSQCELAWTSFALPAKLFRFDNRMKDKRHPTQKPVELYAYLLKTYAQEGWKIFDPMMGSQSSRIACFKVGFEYYGCEVDKEFFETGNRWFRQECLGEIYTNGEIVKQQKLF